MIGKMVRSQSVTEFKSISTACVGNAVHVTFKGDNSVVGIREHLICLSSCDCGPEDKPRSGETKPVEFIDAARAQVEDYLNRSNQR